MAKAVNFPRIIELRAYVQGSRETSEIYPYLELKEKHWLDGCPSPLVSPMARYSAYRATWTSWGAGVIGTLVVEVQAADGSTGVGVATAGEAGCYIAEKHLSRFVEGQDPRNIELIWDLMFRASISYGRKGLALQVISAIDLALWDLLGKLRKEPVYALLGGKTKSRLPVYCTSARPDIDKDLGFPGSKLTCPHGTAEGEEGFKKNVDFVRGWREKVGSDYPLMLDCYMGLSVPYTVRLAKALEPIGLKWIEDYLMPDDYNGYDDVRKGLRGSSVLLTGGEHEYTRYGFQRLLESRCLDIVQPEIMAVGGITEARRVVAMASAYDTMVIPHACGVYAYHLQYAFPNCPAAEYVNFSPASDQILPYFGTLFDDEPLPEKGFITLPDVPGFGVTLNKDSLVRPYPREVTATNPAEITEPDLTPAMLPF